MSHSKVQTWVTTAVTAAATETLTQCRGVTAASMQVVFTTAAPTAATVKLQGSIDGSNWTTLLTLTETSTTGQLAGCDTTDNILPCTKLRIDVSGITIGTCTGIKAYVAAAY